MTEEELISKKEVLEQTGISYGQFYRWKREGLIPESWFMRKSTFTGQETFLPKQKILERIEKIKALKDTKSLEEIAQLLSPELKDRRFERDEVLGLGWLGREVLEYYEAIRKESGPFSFRELIFLAVIETLRKYELDPEELNLVISTLFSSDFAKLQSKEFAWVLALVRKELPGSFALTGRKPYLSACLLYTQECLCDPQAQVVAQIELNKVLEDVKLKLGAL
jgi:DNA-binding transcriptional MerR regulator